MRRHFEKRDLTATTAESTLPNDNVALQQQQAQQPPPLPERRRSRRQTWSGVLGWRNKQKSRNTIATSTATATAHDTHGMTDDRNADNISSLHAPPQQQQNTTSIGTITATRTTSNTTTNSSITPVNPLSPPSTIYSVATTIHVQDRYSPQQNASAFHPPTPSELPDDITTPPGVILHENDPYLDDEVRMNRKIQPVVALTVLLRSTYLKRNPTFRYDSSRNPRRVLTKPGVGCKNNNYDNENSDLILYVNCVLGGTGGESKNAYVVREMLGSGTFGQVVKCLDTSTGRLVGVKVIKNKPAYLKQSMVEVDILKHLNKDWDPKGDHHILRLLDVFSYRHHLCLVFELLSVNLYELIKQNKFRGLSINLVRVLSAQIIDVLIILKEAGIIHCDLKPENILLKNLESPAIKVIDFGSACHKSNRLYTYIQSRFYRSPEVLLGIKYTNAIDMWSFGCIVAELFLGLPLFPGSSEYNQLSRIIDSLGLPPVYMTEQGRNSRRFFNRVEKEGRISYTFKNRYQFMDEENRNEKVGKKYFSTTNLEDLILTYPMPRKHMSEKDKTKEMKKRICLIDFLKHVLQIDPMRRMTPHEAKHHPFITGEYATFTSNSSQHQHTSSTTTPLEKQQKTTTKTTTSTTINPNNNKNNEPSTSSHDHHPPQQEQQIITTTAPTYQQEQDQKENDMRLMKREVDLSNCCICDIDKEAQLRQHKAEQHQEREFKKAAFHDNNTTSVPLSPVESNVKEAAVACISTATNIPQSNRGSRRSSVVGFGMSNNEEDVLRFRQKTSL
ncbi:kinase-like domain-containing protein [Phascolomyces articulosus]|uniref:Kinase-like domain-containing protein n=1 Tax=Phascolomyces articulosus TaxID=60185 RepID=A0AAD5K2X4_9FUNG|nr:kinase-like domain-containing protein [Phascolomyces articulosus]